MGLLRIVLLALAALLAATATHAQVTFRAAAQAGAASGSATIAFRASAQAGAGSGVLTLTVNRPAGTVQNDVMIASIGVRPNTATVTAPAGWTLVRRINSTSGSSNSLLVYRRVAGASEPANYSWTFSTSTGSTGGILAFSSVDTANPIDVENGQPTPAALSHATPSVTTTVANTMLVTSHTFASAQPWTPPGGMTERVDVLGGLQSTEINNILQVAAGATGTKTATAAADADSGNTHILALRPGTPSLTINVPAGTVSGDVMVAAIAVRPSTVLITPPAGWTPQTATVQSAANSNRQQIFYRVASGAEPASYTWTFASPHAGAAGGIVSYSGVDTTTQIDAFAGNTTPQGGDTNLQHRALSVTTTVPDAMVISTHSFSSAETWTASAGMTERVDVASQGTPSTAGISLAMNEVAQAAAGATGDKVAVAAGNGDTGVAHLIALRPFVPQPVLHWTQDQLSWNGTAGEAVDLSGNNLHGTAFLGANTAFVTPAIAGSPGTCRYGSFDGVDDYVEVADNALLDVTDELTVMMWLRPTAYPGAGLKTFVSKDANYEAHLTTTGNINWWWGGGALQLNSAGTVPLNQWTHVALVYSRSGGFQRIYLDGVADANTNNQTGALVPNNMPFQIGADQGFAGRQFPGLIDEVYVFRSALSQSRIQQYMNTTRACASAINHFAISHSGSGIACVDQAITVTAHDASHAAVDANGLLVNLSTTNAKGTWTAILAGGGTLTDAIPGDGAATYQFAAGSNSVQFAIRYADLAATSETLGFNVSGGGFSESTGTASGSDDPSFTMAQAGFQLRNVTDGNTTIPTQISGKPSNTGFNAKTLRVQAIRTDTVTGSCTGLFASQTRSVDLGAECNSPATCAARQVSVNATNIATSNDNGGTGATAYTGVSLTFNASSEADAVITYPDAGQISLHARYDLDPLVAGFETIGSSNTFVVRPFGLAFPGINHNSTAAGSLIGAAGDNFAMTVQAYQWAAGEDANNDGIPDAAVNITDNGTVPNFAATATVGRSANLPGVALGTVSRGVACVGAPSIALSGGAGTAADWCYSEVGNVNLTADVTNYISAGINITGNSGLDGDAGGGYVGRFKPKSFAVTGAPALTNRSNLACAPASSFNYMNEALSLGFALEARNTQNALTQNYTGAYAKLNLASAASLGIGARSGVTNLTGRVDSSLAPTGSFTNGSAALVALTAIARATPDTPDGPYAGTQFGIAPNDNDPDAAGGVQMGSFDQDVDGVGGNDHFALGPTTELRFGRLRLQNGYAPDTVGLQLPLDLQYWNGSGFAVNSLDSCTALARSDIALTFTGVVAACDTAVLEASVAFASGLSKLTLAAPGAGKTGTVLLTPNLGTAAGTYCPAKGAATGAATASPASYLLGRWDDSANPDANANTAYDDKPTGRATFGLYGSQPKNFIFFRENY